MNIEIIYYRLLVFGILYAVIVYWLSKHGLTEPYTALLVVLGVGVTLYGCYTYETITGHITTIQVFTAFVYSGSPMIAGDIADYMHRRLSGRKLINRAMETGNDSTKRMA